jgi:hypothetical protein
MTTHPFTISGAQNAVSAREDIEDALQALASNNSADNEPSNPYANMWWYETDTQLLKIRDEDNLVWINVAYINQSTNKFEILDYTKVVTTSGYQVGILGAQSAGTWLAGISDIESLVSPVKIKATIDSLVPETLGENQSYAFTILTTNTWYQNTTGRAIAIYYQLLAGGGDAYVNATTPSGGFPVGGGDGDSGTYDNGYFIVPNGHYYRTTGSNNRRAVMLS